MPLVHTCPYLRTLWYYEHHYNYEDTSVLGQNSRPVFSKRTLSLRPRRNSGIPERKTRILMEPTISLRRTFPLALTWKVKMKKNSGKCWLLLRTTCYTPLFCGVTPENKEVYTVTSVLSNTANLKQGVPTRRLTDSMTSRKTSFFLYLMPSDLQDTALVTVAGGLGAPVSSLWPSWVMYLREEE